MIINSLKLTNLGPFRGLHEFHLKTNSKKPIVLFGALNGSGKTTIFDSIQLALFGKHIKAAGKFKGKYDNYLKSLKDISYHGEKYIKPPALSKQLFYGFEQSDLLKSYRNRLVIDWGKSQTYIQKKLDKENDHSH